MNIVLAPDCFEESVTASRAVAAMRSGVLSAIPDAECVGVSMADGGEGTVDAIVDALGRHIVVDVQTRSAGSPGRATVTSRTAGWP